MILTRATKEVEENYELGELDTFRVEKNNNCIRLFINDEEITFIKEMKITQTIDINPIIKLRRTIM